MNKRLFGGRDYDYTHKPTDFYLDEKTLAQPLHWRKPRTVFVCSMGDLFHENVPDELIVRVFDVMPKADLHTFMVLTKRSKRLLDFEGETSENVLLGVTVENQEQAGLRIPDLLSCDMSVRGFFISVEPTLGPIDLLEYQPFVNQRYPMNKLERIGHCSEPHICWVIAGCESGPGARPANIDWFRSLRDQCVAAGVPFFLKQMVVDGKITKLPLLDGNRWEQRPA